jgi:hypothetical protein
MKWLIAAQPPSRTLPRFAGEGGLGVAENVRAWQGNQSTGSALGAPSPAKRGRVREGARGAEISQHRRRHILCIATATGGPFLIV